MPITKFNIRVYGIWINDNDEVLLSDEYFNETYITKFPGGGLQFGEGLIDALKREWKEELKVEIDVLNHFYTTDFLQVSAFNQNSQVISIYYVVSPKTNPELEFKTKPFDFPDLHEGAEAFRFVPISDLNESAVTFPIDKKVVVLIKEKSGL